MTWEDIVAIGLALPGVELGASYGRPALKLRGKMLVAEGKAAGHFVLSAPLDEVEMLKDTDPDAFFQTPHYEGWPAVLVRYAAADPERIAALIERAWQRGASKAQRAARK
ncbi:hypothetical protein IP88_11465 [alpha proteobacterium AAP81b]|nr:hypothetical protein IP88_11465 [alpha proteobacterium AAP81b]